MLIYLKSLLLFILVGCLSSCMDEKVRNTKTTNAKPIQDTQVAPIVYASLVDSLYDTGVLIGFEDIIDRNHDSIKMSELDNGFSFRNDSLYSVLFSSKWAIIIVDYYLSKTNFVWTIIGNSDSTYNTTFKGYFPPYYISFVQQKPNWDSLFTYFSKIQTAQKLDRNRDDFYVDGGTDLLFYNGKQFYYRDGFYYYNLPNELIMFFYNENRRNFK